MSRTKESLTYPEAVEILADPESTQALRGAAAARIEMTLKGAEDDVARDVALDLLAIVHPEV